MTIKITKTMRYEIEYDKELYDLLSDIQYAVWRIKNKAITMAWDWQQFSFGYNERFGEYPKAKELLGKNVANDINGFTKELGSFMYSTIYSASATEAVNKFEKEKSDVLAGRQAISQYRRNGSFPIGSKQINNLARISSKKYSANLSLLCEQGAKGRAAKIRITVTLRTGACANDILDRSIDGTYRLCYSRTSKVKTKFYLLATDECEKGDVKANKSRVMGADLGIVNAAYL